jgi:endonuclease-8
MRVLVATDDAVAVGFNVPVAELLTARQLARHPDVQALGPDLLAAEGSADAPHAKGFDKAEAIRRLRARDRDVIADVLLNQRVIAGIGNVFKSEILYLAGLDPFTTVSSLDDAELDRLLDIARAQLAANVMTRSQTLTPFVGRRTTRRLDPREKLWVYGRGGKPCRRCGAAIQSKKTGVDARLTYWCPACQRPRPAR